VAPVFTLMEDVVLTHMRQLVGWPDGEGDGIFAPGTLRASSFPPY
jgi:glutamate decarboxylase